MYATAYYEATEGQTQFTVSFSYRDIDTIRVFVDGTELDSSEFTEENGIITTSEMSGGEQITIKRETDITTRQVDFADAAILSEDDLDGALIQVFQKLQELQDKVDELEGE